METRNAAKKLCRGLTQRTEEVVEEKNIESLAINGRLMKLESCQHYQRKFYLDGVYSPPIKYRGRFDIVHKEWTKYK